MHDNTLDLDASIRVSSLAIGIYDFVRTLPEEWYLYRSQRSPFHLSRTCILFILNRYVSIMTLVVSNVGYFAIFSPEACSHFFLLAPCFKVLASMISQTILGLRTFTLARKARWVGWTMSVLFVVTAALEWFANIYLRTSVPPKGIHDCISGNEIKHIAWIHYMVAIIYDAVALGLSTWFLWTYSSTSEALFPLIRRLLLEGLGYFVVMTAANVLNLAMYLGEEPVQSSAASFGYTIAWIMGQRLLLNHYAVMREHSGRLATDVVALETSGDVNRALRSQFETQKGSTLPDFIMTARSDTRLGDDTEMDVQVHIEQNVKFDYYSQSEMDRAQKRSYRTPRSLSPIGSPSTLDN